MRPGLRASPSIACSQYPNAICRIPVTRFAAVESAALSRGCLERAYPARGFHSPISMPALALHLLCVLAVLVIEQAPAAEVVVHASRQGDMLEVEASAEFAADVRQTWRVLTDYDRLADFIPGMHVSRILRRDGNGLLLEQKGEARLLFFSYPIEVKLAVDEFPYERITSRAVAGNFKEMRGHYHIEAAEGRITLRYRGRLTPDFFVPPLIGTIVLRKNVERQFGALVDEILRRQKRGPQSGPAHP